MPSTPVMTQSGGHVLVSGNYYSGTMQLVGGIQLKLAKAAPSLIYIGLPNLSGTVATSTSGGSMTSGGMTDGMELNPGDAYFISRTRLQLSGIVTPESIRIIAPAAASGGRLFWEPI